MALIELGSIVSEVRGSIGGVTYSRNGSGAYARRRVTPVNPNSVPQVGIRSAMSIVSVAWVNALSAAQRAAWDAYALGTPIPNKLGQPTNVGGRQMFLRTNNARQFLGLGIVQAAPATPGVAAAPTTIYAGDTTDGIEGQTTSPIASAADVVNYRIGIAVNQSVNFYATPFTTAVAVVMATAQPFLIKPNTEVQIGQRYFLEARFFQADGKVSFPVQDFIDILA